MNYLNDILINLSAWGIVAFFAAILSGIVWFSLKREKQPLLPPKRYRYIPWQGESVVFAFLSFFLWPVAFVLFSQRLFGEATEENRFVYEYIAICLAFPFQIITIVYFLRVVSGTKLYQIGFHTSYLRQALLLACLAFLTVVFLVLAVNLGVELTQLLITDEPPEEHGLEKMISQNPSLLKWLLLIVTALIVAPVMEELIFRGVFQGWASQEAWRVEFFMFGAFLIGIILHYEDRIGISIFWLCLLIGFRLFPNMLVRFFDKGTTKKKEQKERFSEKEGELTEENLSDFYKYVLKITNQGKMLIRFRSIYACSAMFAMMHTWPTPIPLFLLGLALGWLAHRTQGLAAPIFLHFLFNGVAFMSLILKQAMALE